MRQNSRFARVVSEKLNYSKILRWTNAVLLVHVSTQQMLCLCIYVRAHRVCACKHLTDAVLMYLRTCAPSVCM